MSMLKPIVILSLLLTSLAAEEMDAAAKCDTSHDACVEKCDKAEDGSSECYETCETAYEKCLSQAQEQE